MKHFVRNLEKYCLAVVLAMLVVTAFVLPINACCQNPLTDDAIVKLVKAGLTEHVIIGMVNLQPGQGSLTSNDLIALKKDGVSDNWKNVPFRKVE